MTRISFRQGMLSGFILIVLMLGGSSVQGWLLLEHLVSQSRYNSAQALQLTAAVQELVERTVDMERSARQYLILDDPVYRQRFDEHLAQSLQLVDRIDGLAARSQTSLLRAWRRTAEELRRRLDRKLGQAQLTPLLELLVDFNDRLRQGSRRWIETQNAQLFSQLEEQRVELGGRMALALGGAVLVAMLMAWWLLRPVRQLEEAIGRLGAGRFGEAVAVGGPADLRQLGRRLDWLRQHLAELEEDRQRALRHVSHTLKTPLTALKEGIALLSEEVPGPLASGQREVVDILNHNVAGLQGQIESLLRLNAEAFRARRLKVARVNVRRLLEEVTQHRDLHRQSRQLDIRITAPEAGALLDREKMGVILDNLLSNAMDFSPQGGVVDLKAGREGKKWRFECIDQGPGVAPEDTTRIFHPFVQGRLEAPVARHGSGVGLSIVRELVLAMGGSVTLLPSRRGAHFCVEIPDEN